MIHWTQGIGKICSDISERPVVVQTSIMHTVIAPLLCADTHALTRNDVRIYNTVTHVTFQLTRLVPLSQYPWPMFRLQYLRQPVPHHLYFILSYFKICDKLLCGQCTYFPHLTGLAARQVWPVLTQYIKQPLGQPTAVSSLGNTNT
jgi:hypothetical protein